jgi:hypothetical protein
MKKKKKNFRLKSRPAAMREKGKRAENYRDEQESLL